MSTPSDRLRHHITGAIERGETEAIVEQPARTLHSLTLLRTVEDMIYTRLGRRALLDDVSSVELEQLYFMARDPQNATNHQLSLALNEILHVD